MTEHTLTATPSPKRQSRFRKEEIKRNRNSPDLIDFLSPKSPNKRRRMTNYAIYIAMYRIYNYI